ncbi:tetratricopeptide repeat protein [Pseudobacteriovorax antillogorgiicola]|nr:tetratricopeptide repeat protein [Pseudobacteriovorax antillogorgiicola]
MNSNNQKKYEDSIARARRISPDSKAIKELEAKNALRANQTEKARDLMNQLPSLKNVVRFTNNRAVALIQCDRFQEGIEAYKQALVALPSNKVELRCIVLYNLGLAYARADNLEEALATLKQALISQDKQRRTRVKSLMKKVLHAKKSGEPLLLPNAKSGHPLTSQEQLGDLDQDIVYAMSLDPGESCCFRIFFHYQSEVPLEPYLNLKRPKFILRESIKKEYALGLEKLMKAG